MRSKKRTDRKMGKPLVLVPILLFLVMGNLLGQTTIPQGPHGAASDAFQEEYLQSLQKNPVSPDGVPPGISPKYWKANIPEGNDPTPERIALGKKLYFEPKLSIDGTVSCATCHDITRGFGDALPVSEGVDKQTPKGKIKQFGTRNAPTVMNITLLHSMFWDGRSPTVEHQAMQPIINPVEMGMPDNEKSIIAKIKDDPEYKKMFKAAYGRDVNYKDIGNAIAVFERTLVFMDNPFFRYLKGDEDAISDDAKAGWILFNREGRCNSCHQMSPSNPLGTDNKFHNIGISAYHGHFNDLVQKANKALEAGASEAMIDELALSTDMGELGRFLITGNVNDMAAFRTPMILNVGITGPYMHDGSVATLWDVVDHYNKGGEPNLYLDGGIEPLNLSEEEVNQLVAFLFSLTDVRFSDLNDRIMEQQRNLAAKSRPDRNEDVASRKVLLFENFKAGKPMKGTEK